MWQPSWLRGEDTGCKGDAFRTSFSLALSTLSKGNHGSLVSVCWDIPTWSDLIWKVSCRVKRELQSSAVCHSSEVTACLQDEQELLGQGQRSLILPQTSPCFWKFLLTLVLVNSNAENSLPQGHGLVPLTIAAPVLLPPHDSTPTDLGPGPPSSPRV